MNEENKLINIRAQSILDICSGGNSSSCVLSLLSVIEHIAFNESAKTSFKIKTASLLSDQAKRIISATNINRKIN